MSMKRAEVMRDYGGISADDRRTDRRKKLLTAARQIWGASGVSEVTVRGVCSAAGLTTRYFYEQFANRDALLYAVGAAVIGGTSLFGGRGRMIDALIGGAVVEVIYNGTATLILKSWTSTSS